MARLDVGRLQAMRIEADRLGQRPGPTVAFQRAEGAFREAVAAAGRGLLDEIAAWDATAASLRKTLSGRDHELEKARERVAWAEEEVARLRDGKAGPARADCVFCRGEGIARMAEATTGRLLPVACPDCMIRRLREEAEDAREALRDRERGIHEAIVDSTDCDACPDDGRCSVDDALDCQERAARCWWEVLEALPERLAREGVAFPGLPEGFSARDAVEEIVHDEIATWAVTGPRRADPRKTVGSPFDDLKTSMAPEVWAERLAMAEEAEARRERAVAFLAVLDRLPGKDYRLRAAEAEADRVAFEAERDRLARRKGGGHFPGRGFFPLEGATGHASDCRGWDGRSERCLCRRERVEWAPGPGHSFEAPAAIPRIVPEKREEP